MEANARRPLKVTFVCPRLNLSGGIKVVRIVSDALVARGHDVTVAYLSAPRPWPDPWKVRQMWREVVRRYQASRRPQHHMSGATARMLPFADPETAGPLIPESDVIIATWWETAEWIQAWGRAKGVPLYYVQHHELHGGPPERVAATYRLPMKKICIAHWLQREMAQTYGDSNTVLVPNGMEWGRFNSTPRGKASIPTVGFMYGTQPYKGARVAIDALNRMKKEIPNLRAIAFGSKAFTPDVNPPSWLEFEQGPMQSRIPELYRSADVWLLPSTTEGFGLPGLEAMACRCPVVSTKCGGPEDYVIDGKTGYLVDVDDSVAMACRALDVLRMSDADWREMSEAAYATAQGFTWERSIVLFEEALYNAVGETDSV